MVRAGEVEERELTVLVDTDRHVRGGVHRLPWEVKEGKTAKGLESDGADEATEDEDGEE